MCKFFWKNLKDGKYERSMRWWLNLKLLSSKHASYQCSPLSKWNLQHAHRHMKQWNCRNSNLSFDFYSLLFFAKFFYQIPIWRTFQQFTGVLSLAKESQFDHFCVLACTLAQPHTNHGTARIHSHFALTGAVISLTWNLSFKITAESHPSSFTCDHCSPTSILL